jgi:hypothetical protein
LRQTSRHAPLPTGFCPPLRLTLGAFMCGSR